MLSLFSTLVCVEAQLTISASSAMAVLVLSKIRICFMLFIACLVEGCLGSGLIRMGMRGRRDLPARFFRSLRGEIIMDPD